MIKILAIDHIVLRTTKLEKMLHFYIEILGCTLERDAAKSLGLTQLRAGSALIDLVDVDSVLGKKGGGAPSQTENNLDHFCLKIAPLSQEDLLKHLKSYYMDHTDFAIRYGAEGFGESLYIQDPEGNTIELRNQKTLN